MRVLLDTNVILDAMLQLAPWHVDADAIFKSASDGRLTCASTVLSLANAFYVGRRTLGTDRARAGVRLYLRAFEIVPLDEWTLHDADALPGSDLEDNIQIAAAVRSAVDAIITRDPAGFTASPVRVRTPADLVKDLAP
jgi:predicted nucleic acid-binding protein